MHNDIEKLRQFLIQNPYFNLSGICIKLGFHKQLLMNFVSKGYGLGTKKQEDKVFEFFRNFGYNDTEIDKEKIIDFHSTLIESLKDVEKTLQEFTKLLASFGKTPFHIPTERLRVIAKIKK